MLEKIRVKDILIIIVGSCLYAFGLVAFNMENQLAEGGVPGIALIIKHLFDLDPAYTTFIINIPIILIGAKFLGVRSFIYTIIGSTSLSIFLWTWQRVPYAVNIDHDLLLASLIAGLVGGIGSGIIYRVGGTTGGSDTIAKILEKEKDISMGKTLLAVDFIVLGLSLCYLDIKHMAYTLIASYVFSKTVDFIQDGGFIEKGLIVISDDSEVVAATIIDKLERGVTFLHGEGAYSNTQKKIIFCIVNSRETAEIKRLVTSIDPKAFISIIDIHETIGDGFSYNHINLDKK